VDIANQRDKHGVKRITSLLYELAHYMKDFGIDLQVRVWFYFIQAMIDAVLNHGLSSRTNLNREFSKSLEKVLNI